MARCAPEEQQYEPNGQDVYGRGDARQIQKVNTCRGAAPQRPYLADGARVVDGDQGCEAVCVWICCGGTLRTSRTPPGFVPSQKDEKRCPIEHSVVVNRTEDGGKTFAKRCAVGLRNMHTIWSIATDSISMRPATVWFSDRQRGRSGLVKMAEIVERTVSTNLPPIYAVKIQPNHEGSISDFQVVESLHHKTKTI